ncbi:galactose mutarotase-like protein [Favolaschia claudopus]|uniref:Galactose mutarotase-like protein n=1 Tax=Favolaschia claudopus TaxID=2862362 RepID=A0AAW0D0K2_9AGAR
MYQLVYVLFACLAGLNVFAASVFDRTTIAAPDNSINVDFIEFGAIMTNLRVKNKRGKLVDVVPGFDDASLYAEQGFWHMNGCIGRYANRIKNGTFSIPITKDPQPDGPNVYHTPLNDNNGQDTIHGGIGWDLQNWTRVDRSPTSVKFRRTDAASENGFPGTVIVTATYSVRNGGVLDMLVHATASEKTPIMVTHHDYFNLCIEDGCDDNFGHTLQVFASNRLELDGLSIPTGKLLDVTGTPYDFRNGRALGAVFEEDPNFVIYDTPLIYDKPPHGNHLSERPVTLYSNVSGIRLDIRSNQPATQVYTGPLLIPRKAAHGGPDKQYGWNSTVAIEQEGWLDAINTPEWNVDQIYSPERPFTWKTEYRFSVVH